MLELVAAKQLTESLDDGTCRVTVSTTPIDVPIGIVCELE